jgi:hypothetical protein
MDLGSRITGSRVFPIGAPGFVGFRRKSTFKPSGFSFASPESPLEPLFVGFVHCSTGFAHGSLHLCVSLSQSLMGWCACACMAVRRGEEENGREGKREKESHAGTGEGLLCAVGEKEEKKKKRKWEGGVAVRGTRGREKKKKKERNKEESVRVWGTKE